MLLLLFVVTAVVTGVVVDVVVAAVFTSVVVDIVVAAVSAGVVQVLLISRPLKIHSGSGNICPKFSGVFDEKCNSGVSEGCQRVRKSGKNVLLKSLHKF